jgi:ATP-binding cassette subfamily B protein
MMRYPVLTLGLFATVIIAQCTSLAVPIYLQKLIDGLASSVNGSLSFRAVMIVFVLPLVVVRFFGWLLWRAAGFMESDLHPKIERDLSMRAFRALLDQSYRFFSDNFSGSLVRRVRSLASGFDRMFDRFVWDFLPMLVMLVGSAYLLFSRSIFLGVVLLMWMAVMTITNMIIGRIKFPYDRLRAEKDSEATGALADAITNALNILLFTSRRAEEDNMERRQTEVFLSQRASWRVGEWSNVLQNVASFACELVMMSYVAAEWVAGRMTVGDVVFVQGVLVVLFRNIHDVGRIVRTVYESSADASEMIEMLNQTPEILDAKNAKPLAVTRGAISFKDVRFRYTGGKRILEAFSLAIKPREKIALVGPSGSGKSTVTKLLFRFFDIQQGVITIDAQNIAKVTQDSLRASIAFVPQEPILFHRTLMENIRYGRPSATDDEVFAAAKKAHCHEFIEAQPEGYATYVGERGIKLSGGERQRVAIARAILKDAPILVLDEATSSLDSESESLIQDALQQLMKNKTVIVIAHRLSTIMEMDRIIVMQHGKVVDEGTHEALQKRVGMYRTLWNIQAGGFIGERV